MELLRTARAVTGHACGRPLPSVVAMVRTRTTVLLLAMLAAVLAGTMPNLSSASFTSQTTNTASTFTAAADWTPPTVTMNSPGSAVAGTVTLSATASDADSGLASVLVEYLDPATSTWKAICTATASPWSCSWDTTKVTDGTYSLRATATDKAGNSAVSDPVSTTVANNLTVVLADPGSYLRGSTALSATVYGGTVSYTVTIEYTTAGSTSGWRTACSGATTSTLSCSWSTTAVANGSYDLRATAVAGKSSATSATVPDTMVDNAAPTVTMTDPGATLSGTVTLSATATDADSGIAQVVIAYAPTGTPAGGSWTTACTLTGSPYSCRFDTTALAGGGYDFRAVATDSAGNTSTSAPVTNRVVDNSVSSVSMEDPGAYLTGTVSLRASASASSGVASVVIQRAAGGTTSWTTVCTITTGTSPYSCPWSSTTVSDGLYDFRAVLTDGAGRTTTSTTMASRRVDNTTLRGYDVQAANGGASVGRLEQNDTLTLTYTDTVKPSTITPAFTGAAMAVQLRLRDGGLLGSSPKDDTVDVLVGGSVINLGSIDLRDDYVKNGKTVTFSATMSATTVAAGSANRTVVTIRLGASSGGGLRTAASAPAMVGTPSAAATDLYGTACSAAPVTELGAADKDF